MDNCNYDGDTPLHVAAANGKLEDVMYLLKKRKACLFVRNGYVVTALTSRNQRIADFKLWNNSNIFLKCSAL